MLKTKLERLTVAASLVAGLMTGCGSAPATEASPHGATAKPAAATRVVAPGRVEPRSEEIKVGAEVPGRLTQVAVEEGASIVRGQVLARLESADYRARRDEAVAELSLREAERLKLKNGARGQERQEALAATHEAEAVVVNARAEMERRNRLLATGDISRSDAEQTQREYAVAEARLAQAREHYSLVDAGPRADDQLRAAAAVDLARAQVQEAESRLAKTVIRAPVTGIVLRRLHRVGESVAEGPEAPIFIVADTTVLRVRVDVDEGDVGRVREGQKAYVTADAYPGRKFWGHVVRVGKTLGHKNIRTDAPTERIDTKVLETLVELDGRPELPIGLRVDSYILTGEAPQ